ncbi:hypothetical protein BDV3_005071 [Batrachochytrium dendrobatidis]|nr:hypothetical protein QVD99_002503 [Batrachochytrium dendrobatidis]OAJ40603.1 hypothetical protein BDEG_24314 [Batrachochytrium dendrobatidis JEL423]
MSASDLQFKLDAALNRITELECESVPMESLRNASQAAILAYRGIQRAFHKACEIFDHHALPGLEVMTHLGMHSKKTETYPSLGKSNKYSQEKISTPALVASRMYKKAKSVSSEFTIKLQTSYPPKPVRSKKIQEILSTELQLFPQSTQSSVDDVLRPIPEVVHDTDLECLTQLSPQDSTVSCLNETGTNVHIKQIESPRVTRIAQLCSKFETSDFITDSNEVFSSFDNNPTNRQATPIFDNQNVNSNEQSYSFAESTVPIGESRSLRRRAFLPINYKLPSLKVKMRKDEPTFPQSESAFDFETSSPK